MKRNIVSIFILVIFILGILFAYQSMQSDISKETIAKLNINDFLDEKMFTDMNEKISIKDFEYMTIRLYEELTNNYDNQDTKTLYNDDSTFHNKLNEIGITCSFMENTIDINGSLTKEQMCVLLVSVIELAKAELMESEFIFEDEDDISPWAREYVYKAVYSDIISVSEDNFIYPKSNISKEQAVVAFNKLIRKYKWYNTTEEIAELFDEIILNKITAIKNNDKQLYMSTITEKNPYFYNEQERWFRDMTSGKITNVDFQIVSINLLDKSSAKLEIHQSHETDKLFEFQYPLLFKLEEDTWMDYGYMFNEHKTDRFTIKYMNDESRLEYFEEILNQAFDNLDKLYEAKPNPYFEMKLFSDQELLMQRTMPSINWLFLGWSEPDESLKLYSGKPTSYDGYPSTVQHELVHHITVNYCNNNLTEWLIEGIAMYDGSAYYGTEYSSMLSRIKRSDVKMTLDELEAIDLLSDLPGNVITRFYVTSYMYTRYINETYGHDTLMEIFKEAGSKPYNDSNTNENFRKDNLETTSEVIKKVLGITKQELSEEYLKWLETAKL